MIHSRSVKNILPFLYIFFVTHQLNPPYFNEREKSTFYRELEEYGGVLKHPRTQKASVVYKLISIGIVKAMPAFRGISISDQAKLNKIF